MDDWSVLSMSEAGEGEEPISDENWEMACRSDGRLLIWNLKEAYELQ